MEIFTIVIIALALVVLVIFLYYVPFLLWVSAQVSGVRISLVQLFLMRIRKVPPHKIVDCMIEAHKAGLKDVTRDGLEAHYLAGGHIERVVHALVSANKAKIALPFEDATAIALARRDVFEAVQMSVNPCVSAIGSAASHKDVLENPDSISKLVLAKGLDAGTAFQILSIDIADIDVGKNIGAQLQMDQSNADKNIAQAKAEERRAMAVALEQEMKAKEQEMRAYVVQSEAEVPKAMAEAFRNGNLGIMDYYRMKNIEADTNMREAIANPQPKSGKK